MASSVSRQSLAYSSREEPHVNGWRGLPPKHFKSTLRKSSFVGETDINFRIGPGLNANEIQIPYDKYHKVSSLVKSPKHTILSNVRSNMKMSVKPAKYDDGSTN